MALQILDILKEILSIIREEKGELISIKEARRRLNAGTYVTRELAEFGFIDQLRFSEKICIIADSIPRFIDTYRNEDIRELLEQKRREKRERAENERL